MKDIKAIAVLTFKIVVGVHIGKAFAKVVTTTFDYFEKSLLEKAVKKLKEKNEELAHKPHMELNK